MSDRLVRGLFVAALALLIAGLLVAVWTGDRATVGAKLAVTGLILAVPPGFVLTMRAL